MRIKPRYKYGALGSGHLFWKRLFCKHNFENCDMFGCLQQCRKCGMYRSVKR